MIGSSDVGHLDVSGAMAELASDGYAVIPDVLSTAGSIVAVEGRVWHTSGANVTADEDRPLLFGYYTRPFVRPQWNFSVGLGPDTQSRCSMQMRHRLGLDVGLNIAFLGARKVT